MTGRMIWIAPLALVFLAGCEDDGAIGMRGSPAWVSTSTDEQKRAYYTQLCTSRYGLARGTSEMARCVSDVDKTHRLYVGEIAMCPLTASQRKKYATCETDVPKYGPDFLF